MRNNVCDGCACKTCTQRENCNMCKCDECFNHEFETDGSQFVSSCDDWKAY